MTEKSKRAMKAFISYLLTYLVGLSICVAVVELAIIPAMAWLAGYPGYFWPPVSRVYAACKFVPLASLLCAVGTWLYDRKRIGW